MASSVTVKIGNFTGGVNYRYDESVLPTSVASDCYNFDFSSGVLTDGYGIEGVGYFNGYNIKSVFHYKKFNHETGLQDDRVIGVGADGSVYCCPLNSPQNIQKWDGITLAGIPNFVNYRLYGEDVCIITTQNEGMIVYDGVSAPYKVESAPTITSMALHYERLFVTVAGEKNSVWFSDDLDPTNWDASLDGGGFIQLIDERGALNKVVSYLGYVFVFRDYGISRITAYANQADFSVSNLFVSSGRIYPQSVVNCGDRIIFLAEDGLYAFDGVSASKLLSPLGSLIKNGESAVGSYGYGKYYLAFNRDLNGEIVGDEASTFTNNGLLVYDINSGEYALSRGMDLISLTAVNGEVWGCVGSGRVGKITRCGANFGTPLLKKWRVPKSDLGKPGKKTVRQISVFSQSDCKIVLVGDRREKTITVKGKGEVQRRRLCFADKRVGFDFIVSGVGAKISRPTVSVTVNGF